MPQFRARPREIDAIHYDGSEEARAAILAFMGGPEQARVKTALLPGPGRGLTRGIYVYTFTEALPVADGQWIVRHDHGDRRTHEVMGADAFAATYEPIDA